MQAFEGLLHVGRLTIYALASLLIFYHTYTLYDLYLGSGTDIYDVGNANTYALYRHMGGQEHTAHAAADPILLSVRRFCSFIGNFLG